MVVGSVVSSLVSLFLVMFIGFLLRKRGQIDERVTKGLSYILVSVGMPLMIIQGMQQPYSPEKLKDLGVMAAGFAVCILSGVAIAAVYCFLTRKSLRDSGAWLNCAAFSNAIYMGRPIAVSIWGDEAVFPLTGVLFCYTLMTFTLGDFMFKMGDKKKPEEKRGGGVKRTLLAAATNPAIVCGVVGFLLFVNSVVLPAPIIMALDMIVNITTPLSMIIIGSQLAVLPLREIVKDGRVYLLAAIRLVAAPLLSAAVLAPFVKTPLLFGLLTLTALMPTGAVVAVFAERYENNASLASRTVFVSTLLSIATIPPLVALLI